MQVGHFFKILYSERKSSAYKQLHCYPELSWAHYKLINCGLLVGKTSDIQMLCHYEPYLKNSKNKDLDSLCTITISKITTII
jgi:hypothetical protein